MRLQLQRSFSPGGGNDFGDLAVGHVGQPGEHISQISIRIDAATTAALDDRVEDRASLSGGGLSDEELVFLFDSSGPDCVLDQIIVDLDATVIEINLQ